MDHMTALAPPNWRPLPLLGPHVSPNNGLYRAAALSHATRAELAQCPDELTWLDLRTRGELEQESREHLPTTWQHVHAPFMELDVQAGQEAQALDGLIDRSATFGDHYCRMLDVAVANIAQVLRTIGETSGPIVIGCQGGRDRTGLISAILLLAAGADPHVAVDDYIRTNDDLHENLQRQPGGEQTQELFAALDLVCRREDIAQAIDYLASLGGVREYLSSHLPDEEYDRLVASIRIRLGVDPDPSDSSLPLTTPSQKEVTA